MKLRRVLKGIAVDAVYGSKECIITGISSHSKQVAPGNLFVAKKGGRDDGMRYIPEAIRAGAVAVLTDMYDPSLKGVTQVIHRDLSSIESQVVNQFYGFPSSDLLMVGITGTNGKTSITYFVKHLFLLHKIRSGLIGTIEYVSGSWQKEAQHTTPDLFSLHKLLKEMKTEGCQAVVMEVSSHALQQGRVAGVDYDAAVFTNLTPEHLDYHKTMEQYAAAKRRLFLQLSSKKTAVVNVDDPWHQSILKGCKAHVLLYGFDQAADVRAEKMHEDENGTHFTLNYRGERRECFVPLIGRYNLSNCLAAISVALSVKIPLDTVIHALPTLPKVAGRLQRVENSLGIELFVDYAHSEDSLSHVLQALSSWKKGKLYVVFGCGGERDKQKRPKMAQVVERYADFAFVTSDNPRTEDPNGIVAEIIQGFSSQESYQVELDRASAIRLAIEQACSEDVLLIAGKGHEKYQLFAHKTVEFDDVAVAIRFCKEKRSIHV